MRGGQTPGHTTTGRSCMKEAGRGSEQRLWMQSGKRSTRSGPRGPARNYQSGSERGLARRLEMLPLLRERRGVVRKQLPRRKKRKRKKKRSKSSPRHDVMWHCIIITIIIIIFVKRNGILCIFIPVLGRLNI